MTTEETLLASMGYDVAQINGFGPEKLFLPPSLEDQVFRTFQSWSAFCGDIAAWYIASFAQDPIILIGSPTMEMCARYQIPPRRSFIVRTLSRIIEEIGNDHFVGIVDCNYNPLTDPGLAEQANHWVTEFAMHDKMPKFFDALARLPQA